LEGDKVCLWNLYIQILKRGHNQLREDNDSLAWIQDYSEAKEGGGLGLKEYSFVW
jgi:hypothetical protein